jgi:hypothetical protein
MLCAKSNDEMREKMTKDTQGPFSPKRLTCFCASLYPSSTTYSIFQPRRFDRLIVVLGQLPNCIGLAFFLHLGVWDLRGGKGDCRVCDLGGHVDGLCCWWWWSMRSVHEIVERSFELCLRACQDWRKRGRRVSEALRHHCCGCCRGGHKLGGFRVLAL